MNIVRITLDGLSTRIFSSQVVFSNKSNLSSVLSAESKIPGQKSIGYSSLLLFTVTIQARVYYSWLLFKIPFCLFKEARSSFVSTFNLGSYALPSLFFLSHHVTSSSFQAFFKLSSLIHCKIFLLIYII